MAERLQHHVYIPCAPRVTWLDDFRNDNPHTPTQFRCGVKGGCLCCTISEELMMQHSNMIIQLCRSATGAKNRLSFLSSFFFIFLFVAIHGTFHVSSRAWHYKVHRC